MKQYRLNALPDAGEGHFLSGIMPGRYITAGAMNFKKGGDRSHDVGCACASCDGKGRHVHADDSEIFVILQGKAVMQIDGKDHPLVAGDVVVCEPGEDHHLVADRADPCINLFLHVGPERAPQQVG